MSKIAGFLAELFAKIVIVACVLAAVALLVILCYAHWKAYFQRFPHAEWWTFFVQ